MAQITLYLDEETEDMLTRAVGSSGLSRSRWVADLIRKHADDAWPKACLEAAGKFPDFPLHEDLLVNRGVDAPRVSF